MLDLDQPCKGNHLNANSGKTAEGRKTIFQHDVGRKHLIV